MAVRHPPRDHINWPGPILKFVADELAAVAGAQFLDHFADGAKRLLAVVAAIVFMERAQRRLLIQYPKRQVGNRMFQGEASHLPLKLNTSGVIPPIFASSLLLLPITAAQFSQGSGTGSEWLNAIVAALGRGQPLHIVIYVAMIIFFAFFYTAVTFQPVDVADNLKKQQANIPGIRPGRQTAEYIDRVLTRLTTGGAIYIAVICTVPAIVAQSFRIPFQFGGTSLIIVVGVALLFLSFVAADRSSATVGTSPLSRL